MSADETDVALQVARANLAIMATSWIFLVAVLVALPHADAAFACTAGSQSHYTLQSTVLESIVDMRASHRGITGSVTVVDVGEVATSSSVKPPPSKNPTEMNTSSVGTGSAAGPWDRNPNHAANPVFRTNIDLHLPSHREIFKPNVARARVSPNDFSQHPCG